MSQAARRIGEASLSAAFGVGALAAFCYVAHENPRDPFYGVKKIGLEAAMLNVASYLTSYTLINSNINKYVKSMGSLLPGFLGGNALFGPDRDYRDMFAPRPLMVAAVGAFWSAMTLPGVLVAYFSTHPEKIPSLLSKTANVIVYETLIPLIPGGLLATKFIGPWVRKGVNLVANHITTSFAGFFCRRNQYPVTHATPVTPDEKNDEEYQPGLPAIKKVN